MLVNFSSIVLLPRFSLSAVHFTWSTIESLEYIFMPSFRYRIWTSTYGKTFKYLSADISPHTAVIWVWVCAFSHTQIDHTFIDSNACRLIISKFQFGSFPRIICTRDAYMCKLLSQPTFFPLCSDAENVDSLINWAKTNTSLHHLKNKSQIHSSQIFLMPIWLCEFAK